MPQFKYIVKIMIWQDALKFLHEITQIQNMGSLNYINYSEIIYSFEFKMGG